MQPQGLSGQEARSGAAGRHSLCCSPLYWNTQP
eukprot:jgi/Astpho2/3470/gw1.00055.59.1_t